MSEFNRGVLFKLLIEAYSFDYKYEQNCRSDWHNCDNLNIANKCCVITTLNDEAIGFVCWDPRNIPEYVEIGYNCIIPRYKGNGYGKMQLQEAINRIAQADVKRIIVMTDNDLIPAQRNYESVGFNIYEKKMNQNVEHIYYEYLL